MSNVKRFDKMYRGCPLIKDASIISNWNIKSVTSFVNMFNDTIEIHPQWTEGTWNGGTFTKNPIVDTEIGNDTSGGNEAEDGAQSGTEATKARYTLNIKTKTIIDEKGNKVILSNTAIKNALNQKKINNAVNILENAGINVISTTTRTIVIEYTI